MQHPPPAVAQQLSKVQLLERLALSERTLENMVKDATRPYRKGRVLERGGSPKWQERFFAAQENWELK